MVILEAPGICKDLENKIADLDVKINILKGAAKIKIIFVMELK
jgi:hypothetical protein